MAYFRPSIDAEGIHVPTYDDIMEYLIAEYKAVFGEDVYLGEDSKDYQMLSIFARCYDDCNAFALDSYNARNPQYATGDSLDVLCGLAAINRNPAEKASIELTLTGTSGVVVPSGSKAIDTEGRTWTLLDDCEMTGGTGTGTATCDTPGRFFIAENSVNGIYTPYLGWDTVTNQSSTTSGKDTETDEELRKRFYGALRAKANTTVDGILNSILELDDVGDCVVLVNNTGATDSNNIPGHSIAAVVKGGDDQEIANTIFYKKAPGVGTYGSVTKTVVDKYGNSNSISFSHSTDVSVTASVTIQVYDERIDADSLKAIIKGAVYGYLSGMKIGETLYVNKLFGVIYSAISGMSVVVTAISVTDSEAHTDFVSVDWNEAIKIASADSVSVTIAS